MELWWNVYYFSGMNTESIKIDSKVVGKVRKHVKGTKQTIGGFVALAIENELKRIKAAENGALTTPEWIQNHNKQFE